jgi:hypothetical protein
MSCVPANVEFVKVTDALLEDTTTGVGSRAGEMVGVLLATRQACPREKRERERERENEGRSYSCCTDWRSGRKTTQRCRCCPQSRQLPIALWCGSSVEEVPQKTMNELRKGIIKTFFNVRI